ncbi:MAG: hypothetical protein P0S93_04190 [Candidatus Neptunochlamydia sp.]|nr:hypothetical protein [Candidatus Neptunochlamydia sp.]
MQEVNQQAHRADGAIGIDLGVRNLLLALMENSLTPLKNYKGNSLRLKDVWLKRKSFQKKFQAKKRRKKLQFGLILKGILSFQMAHSLFKME